MTWLHPERVTANSIGQRPMNENINNRSPERAKAELFSPKHIARHIQLYIYSEMS